MSTFLSFLSSMKDVPPATSVYWPILSSLLLAASGASHITGTDGISPGTQQETTNAIETLSRYLNRIRPEYGVNESNMIAILTSLFNPSAPSQGILEVEQLARMLSSARDMLINQTSQLFLDDIDNGTGLTELFVKEGVPSGSSTIEPTSAHELADEVSVFHTLNIKCNLLAISIRF
ncbi:hypothetical protein K7X08_020823 [Anisodus acutangulus]|uniref:Uncharacterized protein n=1 Tax=Anisodus acutangulus TaxID=402998 RepID=A0A9Q1MWL7_9SOLA|nr:hypothetical protein K7X08_020823 [Anisodus acutangulus]